MHVSLTDDAGMNPECIPFLVGCALFRRFLHISPSLACWKLFVVGKETCIESDFLNLAICSL